MHFQDDQEDVEDDERPGHHSTSTTANNVDKVKKMFMDDHQITVREVTDDNDKSIGSSHAVISEVVGVNRVTAKFILKLFIYEYEGYACLVF